VKTGSVNGMQLLKRRSSRMALKARITLSGDDRTKCAFTMPAKATKLNRHGAAIQLNRELLVGSTVVLQNTRHAQLSARVVTQVSAQRQGVYTYGVEFLEADTVEKNSGESTFPHPRFRSEDGDCLGQLLKYRQHKFALSFRLSGEQKAQSCDKVFSTPVRHRKALLQEFDFLWLTAIR
jgi:PilZ domain